MVLKSGSSRKAAPHRGAPQPAPLREAARRVHPRVCQAGSMWVSSPRAECLPAPGRPAREHPEASPMECRGGMTSASSRCLAPRAVSGVRKAAALAASREVPPAVRPVRPGPLAVEGPEGARRVLHPRRGLAVHPAQHPPRGRPGLPHRGWLPRLELPARPRRPRRWLHLRRHPPPAGRPHQKWPHQRQLRLPASRRRQKSLRRLRHPRRAERRPRKWPHQQHPRPPMLRPRLQRRNQPRLALPRRHPPPIQRLPRPHP